MLKSIPARILRDTLILQVPTGFDKYQKPTYKTYEVSRVHVQADNSTHKTASNTEVTLRGILFVDGRLSLPHLDYTALQEGAQAAGGLMTCRIKNRAGRISGPYTIQVVDGLPDDEDNLHHWEIGLT